LKKFLTTALMLLMLSAPALAETTQWKFATGWYLSGVTADLVTTDKTLSRCDTCKELNPLLGDRPSDLRLYVSGVVLTGIMYHGLTRLRKKKPKTAMALLILFGAAHSWAAYHNTKVGRSGA